MFDTLEQARLSELHVTSDPETQLRAIIAIHNTRLGPALGGCRFIEYNSETDALNDVIRLAKGMSYKAALAGVPQGGGKAVILKPKQLNNRTQLFSSFGRFVNTLGGRYITAVDSGSHLNDMEVIAQQTNHVAGTRNDGGDPSPATALGVLEGIRSCVKSLYGRDRLKGVQIAIQGIGNVGYPLAEMLHAEGAQLTVTDIDQARLKQANHQLGATVVEPSEIYRVECDIFAPCGLGAVINDQTLPLLNCKAIAGSANNQLASDHHGALLQKRGILYAPDFIINAGGLIHVSLARRDVDASTIREKTLRIGHTIDTLLERAQAEGKATSDVANTMAEEILFAPSLPDRQNRDRDDKKESAA